MTIVKSCLVKLTYILHVHVIVTRSLKNVLTTTDLVCEVFGFLFSIKMEKSLNQYQYWANQFEQLPLYFMNFYGTVDIDTVIEVQYHNGHCLQWYIQYYHVR